jgi:hypothetical protein
MSRICRTAENISKQNFTSSKRDWMEVMEAILTPAELRTNTLSIPRSSHFSISMKSPTLFETGSRRRTRRISRKKLKN